MTFGAAGGLRRHRRGAGRHQDAEQHDSFHVDSSSEKTTLPRTRDAAAGSLAGRGLEVAEPLEATARHGAGTSCTCATISFANCRRAPRTAAALDLDLRGNPFTELPDWIVEWPALPEARSAMGEADVDSGGDSHARSARLPRIVVRTE